MGSSHVRPFFGQIVAICVMMVQADTFRLTLGLPLRDLPAPAPGGNSPSQPAIGCGVWGLLCVSDYSVK